MQAPAGPGQHDMEQRGEQDRPDDRRQRVVVDPLADAEHVCRDGGRLVVRRRVDEPQQDEPGAQRGDERGHADRDREEAVDQADHQPEQQREEEREQAGEAVEVDQVVHEVGGEPDDEADRQVDLAADQQEDLAERDDDDGGRVVGPQRDLVRLRGEVRSLVDQRSRGTAPPRSRTRSPRAAARARGGLAAARRRHPSALAVGRRPSLGSAPPCHSLDPSPLLSPLPVASEQPCQPQRVRAGRGSPGTGLPARREQDITCSSSPSAC